MTRAMAASKACFGEWIERPDVYAATGTEAPVALVTPGVGNHTRSEENMGSVGKVWLITCDCRALVQALADAVLASGHNLVATAADGAPLNELLERYGDQLRVVPIDVTNGLAAESAIEATLHAFGRLDVLVLDLAKWRSAITPATCLRDLLFPSEQGLSASLMTSRTAWSEGTRGEPAGVGNDGPQPRERAG